MLRNLNRVHAHLSTALPMTLAGDGDLVFLLFIPVLWTIWIWVHIQCAYLLTYVLTRAIDDRLETRNYLLCMPNIFQFPRYVLLRQCGGVSS